MQTPPLPPSVQSPQPRSRPSTARSHRHSRDSTESSVQFPAILSSAPTTLIGKASAGSSSARRRTPEQAGGSDGDEEDGRKRKRLCTMSPESCHPILLLPTGRAGIGRDDLTGMPKSIQNGTPYLLDELGRGE